MEVTEADGSHYIPPPFSTRHYKGCVFHALSPGGGGWGNPLDRPVEKVFEDVRGGLVSVQATESVYGVVLDADGGSVDLEATECLRKPQLAHVAGR